MADDIVSTVRIEGADEAEQEFDQLASSGEKSMGRLAASVEPTNKELEKIGKHVEGVARKFGESIRNVGSAASSFVSNVTRMVGTVAKFAAMAGLGAAAIKKFSDANQEASAEVKEQVAQSRLQARGFADVQIRALQNEKTIRDLDRSFALGRITMKDYTKQLIDLQHQQAEESKLAAQTQLIRSAEAEDRIRAEGAIKKEAAERKAYADAVKSYGADVAGALQGFARAWDGFQAKLNQGPSVIADIMRGLTQLLQQHGTEIVQIFDRIGNAFGSLFAGEGGDRVQGFQETFMTMLRAIEGGITGILIPALKGILFVFDQIAWAINSVFGTKFSGAVIASALAIAAYTGALRLAFGAVMMLVRGFTLLRTAMMAMGGLSLLLNPWLLVIAAVIAAVALLIIYWDDVKAAVTVAVNYVSGLLAQLATDWAATVAQFKAAWATVEGWWTSLWTALENVANTSKWADDWAASVEQFKGYWNTAIQWFTDLWEQIKTIAANAWNAMAQYAGEAVAKIKAKLVELVPGLKQILDLFGQIKAEAATVPESGGGGGYTRGGPIRGAGTSTSDSIPIRVSAGEWVIRAKAVQHYGRQFMAALNSMRLPRDGFSLGGLIADRLRVPGPRFAEGGQVTSAMRPINLSINSEAFGGMLAPEDVAQRLIRVAIGQQIRSAGRKPTYYGRAR